MATLVEIVAGVQAALADIDVASIPETPPENIGDPDLPALVVYSANGGFRFDTMDDGSGSPGKSGDHTIFVDLHITRTDLALDVATAMPFAESITNALFFGFLDTRFDGTVTILGTGGTLPIRYELTEMRWGGRQTVGWRFQMDVSTASSIA